MDDFDGYKIKNQEEGIKLDANESSHNIYGRLIREKVNFTSLNRYPILGNDELKSLYADFIGLSKDNVIAGNGSDEMLNLIIGYKVGKDKKVMTLNPDFSMYDFFTYFNDGDIVKYNLDDECNLNVDDFISKANKESPDLIIFSNPNNPTGNFLKKKEIIKILEGCKEIDIIVDEAYVEFAEESVVDLVEEYKNLLVLRTMSKAWGLAGARLGFLISSKDKIKEISKYDVPYNISSISQKIGIIALKNTHIMKENVKLIKKERNLLYKGLKNLEKESNKRILFYKSSANFIYGKSKIKDFLISYLEKNKIYIRDYEGTDYFRITVGSRKENMILLSKLNIFFTGGNKIVKER